MRNKHLLLTLLFLLACTCQSSAHAQPLLRITGMVRQPLSLTLQDLERYQSLQVQLNEVMEDGSYRGAFYYTGVPLRTLLEAASIQKEGATFSKRIDMAIRIGNEKGKQVALSWGEVFYRNPGRIIVATSASPVIPHKDCGSCHTPERYKPRLDKLKRVIDFPKLVVTGDAYAERSLEGVTSIELLDVCPTMPTQKMEKLFSPEFTIMGTKAGTLNFKDLSRYPRRTIKVKHLGEGRGYHGISTYKGAIFKAVLEEIGLPFDLNLVFLVSADDGYRSLFSYGEIFLDPSGERMIMADTIDGGPIKRGGKFMLVLPDDLMSDRDVKAVKKIEVISLQPDPKP